MRPRPSRSTATYEEVLRRIATEQLQTNVSVKPTHLGLAVDEELAYGNIERLVAEAARRDNFIRIDMEDSPFVDATLRIYRRLREAGHDNVGTVLQAYLFRTPDDLESLLPLEPNLRIVKGAYKEPAAIAYPKKADVDAAYDRLVARCLEGAASRPSRHTTSGGSSTRSPSAPGPTAWSSRCSSACGRSCSSTWCTRATGCWSRPRSGRTGTRT